MLSRVCNGLITGLATILILAVPLPASAQDSTAKATVGFGIGLVDVQNIDSTFYLHGNVRIPIAENIYLQPGVGYWSMTESAFGLTVEIKDLDVSATGLYLLSSDSGFEYGFGAGLGAHILSGEIAAFGIDVGGDSDTRLAFHLLGTAGYRLSESLLLSANLRYDAVSDVGQLKLFGGLRLQL